MSHQFQISPSASTKQQKEDAVEKRMEASLKRKLIIRQPLSREELCAIGPQSKVARTALDRMASIGEIRVLARPAARGKHKNFFVLKDYVLNTLEESKYQEFLPKETFEEYKNTLKRSLLSVLEKSEAPVQRSHLWECIRPPKRILGELLTELEEDGLVEVHSTTSAQSYSPKSKNTDT